MESKSILEFQGHYRWLSNFWPCVIQYQDREWCTAEHAYQAMKTNDRGKQELIRSAHNPRDAKRLGKFCHLRPDWDAVKYPHMLHIVRAKFAQSKSLKKMLLETHDARLEEGNAWGDRYWGICPPGSGDGQNNLGKILMQVREELRDANR